MKLKLCNLNTLHLRFENLWPDFKKKIVEKKRKSFNFEKKIVEKKRKLFNLQTMSLQNDKHIIFQFKSTKLIINECQFLTKMLNQDI